MKRLSLTEVPDGHPHHVAYFYFSFHDGSDQILAVLLRSLISQLCPKEKVDPVIQILYNRYYPVKPSCGDMRKTLMSMLKSLCGKSEDIFGSITNAKMTSETYLIFDGLDEIPFGSSRKGVLELLSEISTMLGAEHIHILATSREEKDISDGLPSSHGWQRYVVDKDHIQEDIAIYTSYQIAANPKLNSLSVKIKEQIQTRLIQGSKGM